uniref:Peptidase S1 domain-containing protein n=1 Tax=Erpetoichthys calabaricus TaxID=27687 RepID=A0A8C4TB06_ERPCA
MLWDFYSVPTCFFTLYSLPGVSGSKIIDGVEAAPHSRPYMNILLTAAHCQGERIIAQLGGHNFRTYEASRQDIAVSRMFPHEFYNSRNYRNDIMLLQLERNVMITPEVQPIKLSTDCADNLPGMPCSVAGWGRTFTGGPGSDVLREVDVTILNICQYEQFNNLMWTVICGRANDCSQSSVGIVSLRNTAECENPNREDVYTNICMFWPWIKMKFSAIAAE